MKYTFLITLFFLSFVGTSQTKFEVGLKIHPNLTFAINKDLSILQSKYFSHNYPQVGLNFGINFCYTNFKTIIEASSGLVTNKVALKLHHFDKEGSYTQIKYVTWSFVNKLNFGFQINENHKPYYKSYFISSLQYSFIGLQGLSSNGAISNTTTVKYINSELPFLENSFKSLGIGFGYKIKTQLRNFRRLDYGISYTYLFTQFPQMFIDAEIDNKKYFAISKPFINQIDIDFVYYFGRKK